MRRFRFLCAVLACYFLSHVLVLHVNGKGEESGRTAKLIRQLGEDRFQRRESASQALLAIGEPALAALREAAATSDDAEIRRRSEELIQTITVQAAQKVLARFVGTWRWQQGSVTVRTVIDSEGRALLPLSLPETVFSSSFFDIALYVKEGEVFTDIQLPTQNTTWQLTLSPDETTLRLKLVKGKGKHEIIMTRESN